MKPHTLFQQYSWLVNTIRRAGRITLVEINEAWLETEMSDGLPIARSTFNRHRDAILDMFGVIISCDKRDGFRYFIENSEVLEEDTIQNWMLSTLFVNSLLSESRSVHDRIILESIPSDGENLHKFIDAMKRSVRIQVTYRRYGAEGETRMKVDPYFVKLHKRRWYALVKFPEPASSLFVLSFDRLLSLELTDESFVYPADFNPTAWFSDCYGIVKDADVPVSRVVVRAFGREAFYLRDLPLHSSQKEIGAGEGYTDFEMFLRPSDDFFTPLLSRGEAIRVLEPQWLADEIKRKHLESAKRYE